MVVKIPVVDDSGLFRRRVSKTLFTDGQIQVVDTAANGREAIEQTLTLRPDVITIDYEMPLTGGTTAVRNIMQCYPTPVPVFSSLTHEGARITLDALDAGATGYLPRNFKDVSRNSDKARQLLCEKALTITRSNRCSISLPSLPSAISSSHAPASSSNLGASAHTSADASPALASTSVVPKRKAYRLVATDTSTGGPVALQRVLTQLPANFPAPLVLIQHIPTAFTKTFAECLDKLCRISTKEAEDGDILRSGLALLTPDGKQMMVGGRGTVRILLGDERLNYKPCVDVTFGSAAKAYNDEVLAVVLIGISADGCEGARLLKQGGNQVWAQGEASYVIYGMPMAVVKANLADAMYGFDGIGRHLVEACQ